MLEGSCFGFDDDEVVAEGLGNGKGDSCLGIVVCGCGLCSRNRDADNGLEGTTAMLALEGGDCGQQNMLLFVAYGFSRREDDPILSTVSFSTSMSELMDATGNGVSCMITSLLCMCFKFQHLSEKLSKS